MNTTLRKSVDARSFTFLPLYLSIFMLLFLVQSASASTQHIAKPHQQTTLDTHKSAKGHSKYKKRKKRTFTCDRYSRHQLLNKADKYQKLISQAARDYKVSPSLITAVITVESCFRPKALSSSGAAGLMQLMPATAKRFGTHDRYNNKHNIKAGTKYLRFLLKRFDGNVTLAAAAYNAGEGAVDKYDGIPPYKETKNYVKKVLNAYQKLSYISPRRHLAPVKAKPASTQNWSRRQYERKLLTRGLDLTIREMEVVDILMQPGTKKSSLSFRQFL